MKSHRLGRNRTAQINTVFIVDHIIAIYVFKFQITRLFSPMVADDAISSALWKTPATWYP